MPIREKTFNDALFERRYPDISLSGFRPGKPKSSDRQLSLLKLGSIYCHCQGGMAMDDPDLQKLIKKGLMKFERHRYSTGWGGNYALNRTVAVRTLKGDQHLAQG